MKITINALLATGLLTAALASGASAQTWTKTGTPGNLPGTAQITTGAGALTTITGTLNNTPAGTSNRSDPDLFEIYITGTGLFSATTVGQATNLFDPRLFLFNSSGVGVYYNDDASTVTAQSALTPSTSLPAGEYYLGIGVHGIVPRDAVPIPAMGTTPAVPTTSANDIFPTIDDFPATTGFTGLYTATGPGGALPLLSWSESSGDVETGFYTIALLGASFAAAPEPGQAAALGLGVLGLGALILKSRRRRSQA